MQRRNGLGALDHEGGGPRLRLWIQLKRNLYERMGVQEFTGIYTPESFDKIAPSGLLEWLIIQMAPDRQCCPRSAIPLISDGRYSTSCVPIHKSGLLKTVRNSDYDLSPLHH